MCEFAGQVLLDANINVHSIAEVLVARDEGKAILIFNGNAEVKMSRDAKVMLDSVDDLICRIVRSNVKLPWAIGRVAQANPDSLHAGIRRK